MTSPKLLDLSNAVGLIRRRPTLMVGGFGLVGKPLGLVDALQDNPKATKLTVISNNLGEPGGGLGRLLRDGRIRKAIGSFFTTNPDAVEAYASGTLEVQLTPQGTLALASSVVAHAGACAPPRQAPPGATAGPASSAHARSPYLTTRASRKLSSLTCSARKPST